MCGCQHPALVRMLQGACFTLMSLEISLEVQPAHTYHRRSFCVCNSGISAVTEVRSLVYFALDWSSRLCHCAPSSHTSHSTQTAELRMMESQHGWVGKDLTASPAPSLHGLGAPQLKLPVAHPWPGVPQGWQIHSSGQAGSSMEAYCVTGTTFRAVVLLCRVTPACPPAPALWAIPGSHSTALGRRAVVKLECCVGARLGDDAKREEFLK